MSLTRRQFIAASAVSLAACSTPRLTLKKDPTQQYRYTLIAEPADVSIVPGTRSALLTFNGDYPAPIIRAKQGEMVHIHFINRLDEPTTIHWHGIRIDNKMDGVPHLTQHPVQAGESFDYEFVCPDAGTFWYHPHMNSIEQLGRGLTGLLIVDEAEPTPYQQDVILELRDWRLGEDGEFLELSSPRQAARAGTLGTVKTVNGQIKPVIEVPAQQLTRLRLANIDNTRVYTIALKEQAAEVIALDGNAVAEPFPLVAQAIGAGMRLDLGLITPEAGKDVVIYDRKGKLYFEICRLRPVGETSAPVPTRVPALPVNPIPRPDLENAETQHFVFEWAGAISPVDDSGKVKSEFWTMNKRAWEGMSAGNLPEPLATLTLGKTYIFKLHNATPHHHPIHLHGYMFTVLDSDKREITPYQTDTILMARNERATIAFVADNPGHWMYHCHVIEHMKTGLMGYITVA